MKLSNSLSLTALALVMALGSNAARADGKLIAIITPSHDNPFFATEADGAAAKIRRPEAPNRRSAASLGYLTTEQPSGAEIPLLRGCVAATRGWIRIDHFRKRQFGAH